MKKETHNYAVSRHTELWHCSVRTKLHA